MEEILKAHYYKPRNSIRIELETQVFYVGCQKDKQNGLQKKS